MTKQYFTNPYNDHGLKWKNSLQILKVEYLSNYLLDHTQISNLSLDHIFQILEIKTTFNGI
jgi:hypothetical protein